MSQLKVYSGHVNAVHKTDILELLRAGTIYIGTKTKVDGFAKLLYTQDPDVECACICVKCKLIFAASESSESATKNL